MARGKKEQKNNFGILILFYFKPQYHSSIDIVLNHHIFQVVNYSFN